MTKRIAIVGMGESRSDFIAGRLLSDSAKILADCEVWAINYMAATIRCDKMVAMDPFDHPDTYHPDRGYPAGHLDWLKRSQLPIISCKAVDGYNIEEYPLEGVTKMFGGFQYFNNSVAYAVALAIYQGAEEILMFGCDYSYPSADWGNHSLEAGRACVEFWLGVAITRGTQVTVAANSSLLDQNTGRPLYGYCPIKESSCQESLQK